LATISFFGHQPSSTLRIDTDSVLLSATFTAICRSSSITIQRTVSYAYWQLARVERQWRTLADGTKALLLSARLFDRCWSFAFLAMVYLRNRTWSKGASAFPFTALTGHDPDLSNIRVFGCPTYVNIDSSQRAKFSPKAWQEIFVGYSFESPSWLVYTPSTKRVIRNRNVTFNETWTPSPTPSGELAASPPLI
jgi:hypothetical protein